MKWTEKQDNYTEKWDIYTHCMLTLLKPAIKLLPIFLLAFILANYTTNYNLLKSSTN
jgi:hypothetical protein